MKSVPLFEKLTGRTRHRPPPHKPIECIERGQVKSLSNIHIEGIATVQVTIKNHKPSGRRRAPIAYRPRATGNPSTLFISMRRASGWKIHVGREDMIISGKIEFYQDKMQMLHRLRRAPARKHEIKSWTDIPDDGGSERQGIAQGNWNALPLLPIYLNGMMMASWNENGVDGNHPWKNFTNQNHGGSLTPIRLFAHACLWRVLGAATGAIGTVEI